MCGLAAADCRPGRRGTRAFRRWSLAMCVSLAAAPAGAQGPPTPAAPQDAPAEALVSCVSAAGARQHCPADTSRGVVLLHETGTRSCIAGLVSRRSLIETHGLSEAQADRFFREPITIRMDISGQVQRVESASIIYGTRFTGD